MTDSAKKSRFATRSSESDLFNAGIDSLLRKFSARGEDLALQTDEEFGLQSRFKLERRLGAGGQGVVFRAFDLELQRNVAIKIVRSESDARIDLQMKEARTLARLQHPGIVGIYSVEQTPKGVPFVVMELLEGSSLNDLVFESVPEKEFSIRTIRQVAEALNYLHSQCFLHGDVTPSNIFICNRRMSAVLTDFGLATQVQNEEEVLGGTRGFMAPECAANSRNSLSVSSDIFSLGATLYFLLTGRPPFSKKANANTKTDISDFGLRTVDFQSPPKIPKSIDSELAAICLKCLALNPSERYDSCASLIDDLNRYSSYKPVKAGYFSFSTRVHLAAKRVLFQRPSTLAIIFTLLSALVFAILLAWAGNNGANPDTDLENEIIARSVNDHESAVTILQKEKGWEWANNLNNLALVHYHRNDFSKAAMLFEEAIELLESQERKSNHLLIPTLNNIGYVRMRMGHLEEANTYFLRALEIAKANGRRSNPEYFNCLSNLGQLHLILGEFDNAKEFTHESLLGLNKDDPRFATGLITLGDVCMHLDQYDAAENHFVESLALIKNAESRSRELATVLKRLFKVLIVKCEYSRALEVCGEIEELNLQLYDQNHAERLWCLNARSYVYIQNGRYTEANRLVGEAIELTKHHFGPDHVRLAELYYQAGLTFQLNGRMDEAARSYQKACEMYDRRLGSNHLVTLNTLDHLAYTLEENGELIAAWSCRAKSLLNSTSKEDSVKFQERVFNLVQLTLSDDFLTSLKGFVLRRLCDYLRLNIVHDN